MSEPSLDQGISPYLRMPLRTLGEACRANGRDNEGAACLSCPLGEVCDRGSVFRKAYRTVLRIGGSRWVK